MPPTLTSGSDGEAARQASATVPVRLTGRGWRRRPRGPTPAGRGRAGQPGDEEPDDAGVGVLPAPASATLGRDLRVTRADPDQESRRTTAGRARRGYRPFGGQTRPFATRPLSRGLRGAAVSEDVQADDVDLAAGIAEERPEANEDPGVGVFARGAGLVPVGVGYD